MEQKRRSVSPYSSARRNAWVVEQLTAALLALLEEKPLGEISVSELCARAGVGRTSFYRNYADKESIVWGHIEGLFRDWTDRWRTEPNLSVKETVRLVFSHFEAHRDFYSLLNKRGLVYLLKDVTLDLCGFNPEQELAAAYASAYAGFFLYGWIEVWFRRGMRDTAEDLLACLPE